MGLRSMRWDEWIGVTYTRVNCWGNSSESKLELDNHYPRFHADKAHRIKERGHKCCKTALEAMDGAVELLEELYGRSFIDIY